ncbi:hypothetical protein CBM2586_B90296 [Cupriavidus phytorum]|uniref:Uncharacterized protein n=1 Tax=Cupriavidus taiwanensis TaxID=164546 RepID=A0A375CNJ5_9BURK|nr:hypothetical protein CBM2586_B90296 [Cupriavidus taiwanensis]
MAFQNIKKDFSRSLAFISLLTVRRNLRHLTLMLGH